MITLTIEEATAAVERCKFVCRPDEDGECELDRFGKPRELVHCFLGGLGADWDTYSVYEELEHADEIFWGDGFLGTGLCIRSTWDKYGWGKPDRVLTYYFDTVTPEVAA